MHSELNEVIAQVHPFHNTNEDMLKCFLLLLYSFRVYVSHITIVHCVSILPEIPVDTFNTFYHYKY